MSASKLIAACLALLFLALPARAANDAALSGSVRTADGKPLAGATVIVYYAGVRTGYSNFCPSCYADCGKRSTTDAQGAFSLSQLDSELWFDLLVARDGYAPAFIRKADPAKGPASGTLTPRRSPDDPAKMVRGRLVDSQGKALADAVVEAEGFRTETGGMYGSIEGLDPLAVTNGEGDFEITYTQPVKQITVMAHARGMSAKRFILDTGAERRTLTLTAGATVQGRLVLKGQPVPNAQMGIVSRNRSAGEFISEERIGTQADGTFLFSNVPAPGNWYIYGKMESIAKSGATQAVQRATTRDGETINVGDVEIVPGHRLSGQVVLSDGKPIPPGMRISVGTDSAWDSQFVLLGPDGKFEFAGIPTDNISINAAVKDYHESAKNPNLSWSVEGFLDGDVSDFVIILDPGKKVYDGQVAGKFRNKPLVSAPKQ